MADLGSGATAVEPFAIVGLSLKLPGGVVDEKSLWEVVESATNLRSEWPESRILLDSFDDGGQGGKPNTIKGPGAHFVREDPGVFDAPFFSITTREAAGMNPQQQWALEAAYHAFENAGIPMESLRGSRTAVYGAYMMDDFMQMSTRDPDNLPRMAVTGLAPMLIPNRVSWFFGLQGPSVLVETGCSSAMVAIDTACNAMRSGDADMSLIVGSTILLSPETTIMLSSMNFLSPDARSYSFDSRANGYARGEGVVALLIKPLQRAIRDGDVIRAVIRATGQNQDGRTPILTQPSASAQEALIRHVYAKAGLDLVDTRYFEAHGTGTPTGDVIEMTGIGNAFRDHRSSEEPLYVGSVKPNIGHLEGSSACASIAKAILILERGVIPPNALFEKLNPGIDATFFRVKIPTECTLWPKPGLRRISVNSFGAGGANAHAILDDAYHYLKAHGLSGFHHCNTSAAQLTNGASFHYTPSPSSPSHHPDDGGEAAAAAAEAVIAHPSTSNGQGENPVETETKTRQTRLLVWSAADAAALRRMLDAYGVYFREHSAGDARQLDLLAHTLSARRSVMTWRSFDVVDEDTCELSLLSSSPSAVGTRIIRSTVGGGGGKLAFVFTGQGAQYVGMGRELLRYAIFRKSLKRSDEVLKGLGCGWSVFDALRNAQEIHHPELSQPLCTVLQIAIVELLRSFGVHPAAVVGHSSGEIAAAYATGALSHASACRVAYWRGQLAGKLRSGRDVSNSGHGSVSRPGDGAMMSVNLSESQVLDRTIAGSLPLDPKTVHVACVNSPTNVTLSGSSQALSILKAHLDEEQIFAHQLNTGVAYHSPAMATIAEEYTQLLGSPSLLEPGEPPRKNGKGAQMISSVSGQVVLPQTLQTPKYWVNNLVSPVRFSDAIQLLSGAQSERGSSKLGLLPLEAAAGITDIVEIGPHNALKRPIQDNLAFISGQSPEANKIRYHSSLERSKPALLTIASLMGALFCHGYAVSVSAVNNDQEEERLLLPPLTDCPPYPFDHSRRYWTDTRLSRDYRLRPHSQGHLLGKRSNDWNPLLPRWRNWLCLETMPWLADHVISGSRVCPGAGMIIMAVEAVKQLLDLAKEKDRAISGFMIKRGQFLAPITVGEAVEDATETEMHIRPVTRAHHEIGRTTRFEARIFSYREGRWNENFRAEIEAEFHDRDNDVNNIHNSPVTINPSDDVLPPLSPIGGGKETKLYHQHVREHVEQSFARCAKAIDTDAFYAFMAKYGSDYGKSFKQLDKVRWNGESSAVAVVDMVSAKQHYVDVDSPVHPAVLDAAVHLVNSYVSKGMTEPLPTLVPRHFESLWISAKVWDVETRLLHLVSELQAPIMSGTGTIEKSLHGLADDGSPLIIFDHLTYAQVSRGEDPGNDNGGGALVDARESPLLYGIAWKPQLSALSGHDLINELSGVVNTANKKSQSHRGNEADSIQAQFLVKLEQAMGAAARKVLGSVTQEQLERGPNFMSKYAALSKSLLGSGEAKADGNSTEVGLGDIGDALEALLGRYKVEAGHQGPPEWRLLPIIARSLGPILRDETDASEILSTAEPAVSEYHTEVSRQFTQDIRFTHFLDLVSHETPGLKILEVGGGIGGMTRHVLSALENLEIETGQTRYGAYTLSHNSPAILDARQNDLSSMHHRLSFQALDIDRAPTEQGFEASGYDLVIAVDALHGISDRGRALSHLRSLLSPRGYLVLVEPAWTQNTHIGICLSYFQDLCVAATSEPGQSRDIRSLAAVSEKEWDDLLIQMGFSGSILAIRGDDSEAAQTRSMLVAAAVSTETISPGTDPCLINNLTGSTSHGDHLTTEFILLLDSALDAQVSLAAEIASQLREIVAVKMMDLASCYQNGQWMSPLTPSDQVVVLSLLEVEQPRLATLSDENFSVLKTVIQSASQILWVMAPAPLPSSSGENTQRRDTINVDPHYSVATGLLRVIRSEYPDKHVVSLLVEPDNSPEGPSMTRNRTKFIHQVLRTCFLGNKTTEAEFVVQNGQIAIARAYHETLLDEKRVARTKPQLRAVPWHCGPAVALEIGTPGLLDTLQFREDLTRETPLGPNEVEVKAEVWPISFRDVFIALGRLKESDRMMGYECAGTVTRVGAGCSSAFSEGDRVVMGTFGCMRSHPRADAHAVFRVPDGLSLNEAVAVINPGMTAYHALVNVARLRCGERVLIHSAAGATGQFAVGVARMLGAEILATVGHDDKKRLLIDRFGIPEDHIFHSRDPSSFARGVKRVTGGRGVDVVLNSLSGDGLLASWECVAPYGRFVEIGKVDIGANSSLPMGGFAKNASFAAIDLVHIINTDKRLTQQLTEKTLELAAAAASDANPAGFVGCPSPLHLYPVSQVEKAFRSMQSAKHSGRILISVQDADAVPKLMIDRSTWRFDENASYVVAGGLGGLGRPMIRWMADRGAKYLILLSRSGGAQSQAATELVSELLEKGIHVSIPRCDVSSAPALSAALGSVLNSTESLPFPPVKGCINATMVLQDAIFENMTHAQWSTTIRSKVNTSWNLHTLLPDNLDFFILLSSISGIYGSAGQSNYAAGCTFQDALARNRTASGHRASVSLDLGWMRDDGVVHESSHLQRRMAGTFSKFTPVATADLLALLDHYCDPALPPLALDQSQVVVGMTTPRETAARGGDASWALRTNLFSALDVHSIEGDGNTDPKTNGTSKEGIGADSSSFSHLFRQADTARERTKVVVTALQAKLARALGVEAEDIDSSGKGLADYGVDSLLAVELRNWMKRDFGVTLAVFEIMQGGRSIRDVAGLVGEGCERKMEA